jgi:hypothetical protein
VYKEREDEYVGMGNEGRQGKKRETRKKKKKRKPLPTSVTLGLFLKFGLRCLLFWIHGRNNEGDERGKTKRRTVGESDFSSAK